MHLHSQYEPIFLYNTMLNISQIKNKNVLVFIMQTEIDNCKALSSDANRYKNVCACSAASSP